MPLLLHLETATKNCAVALSEGGKLLAHQTMVGDGYVHAEKLHLFIAAVFKTASKTPQQLDAVCISEGPGSYTGLRIGVAAAKGLCVALNVPLIAIPTSAVLFEAAPPANIVITLIDARRMEAYATVFDAHGQVLEPTHSHILEPASFANYAGKNICVMGDAAEKAAAVLEVPLAAVHQTYPDAAYMVALGTRAFDANDFADVAYFEPNYFKDFQAGVPRKML